MLHRIIWSWYTGRWWVGCRIWYSDEGTGRGPSPPRPLLAVPNATAHPSTDSVPITVLLYDGRLICGFNVATKGLTMHVALPSTHITPTSNRNQPNINYCKLKLFCLNNKNMDTKYLRYTVIHRKNKEKSPFPDAVYTERFVQHLHTCT